MALLKIHKFILRYKGKNYQAGDTVEMEDTKAKELAARYGSAFTIVEQEVTLPVAETELPAADVTEAVVKPKKKAARKK